MWQLTNSNKLIDKINSKLDKVVHSTTAPLDHDMLWYNTSNSKLYIYDSNEWVPITSASWESIEYITAEAYALLTPEEKADPTKHYIIWAEWQITPSWVTYSATMVGNTKTFSNVDVTSDSMIDIIGTATPSAGIWEINTSNWQFTINSTEQENNIEFYYKIQK